MVVIGRLMVAGRFYKEKKKEKLMGEKRKILCLTCDSFNAIPEEDGPCAVDPLVSFLFSVTVISF